MQKTSYVAQCTCYYDENSTISIQNNFLYCPRHRDQNVGRNHSVRIDNSAFERVEEFKYLGKTSTNKNSLPEEIKSRWRSGNACYHSVQNLFPSRLLSKNLKIKIYI